MSEIPKVTPSVLGNEGCAARVQHLADSGEIVFEESVYDDLPEADRAQLQVVEKISAKVKGVEEPLALVRTRLTET